MVGGAARGPPVTPAAIFWARVLVGAGRGEHGMPGSLLGLRALA